jgi:hypothetical protein
MTTPIHGRTERYIVYHTRTDCLSGEGTQEGAGGERREEGNSEWSFASAREPDDAAFLPRVDFTIYVQDSTAAKESSSTRVVPPIHNIVPMTLD